MVPKNLKPCFMFNTGIPSSFFLTYYTSNMIYWLCIDWKLSIKWCAAVFFNVMWSSALCNSKVCPLQYLTRHVKASRSDFNYASCIAPVILIGHSVESVSSYVNCSIMLRIPHVHHPYAFLSREFMNYVIGSVWKRCKFVFFSASVRAARG